MNEDWYFQVYKKVQEAVNQGVLHLQEYDSTQLTEDTRRKKKLYLKV